MRSIRFETSISAVGIRCSAISTTVTSVPKLEKILAHSIPMAPEPIIKTDLGKVFKFSTSSEDRINLPSNSSPFSSRGFEPVAVIILPILYSLFSAVIVLITVLKVQLR